MSGAKKKLLSKEQIEQVQRMAEKGIPQELMGHIFGISPRTMERRIADQPEVREAWLVGATKAAAEIFMTNWECAKNPDNVADRLFYIKTQGAKLCGSKEDGALDLDELRLSVVR